MFWESFFVPLCYTFIMQCNYWPTWKNFLARWGLISPACTLIEFSDALIPIAAQMMYLGMPLFKGAALGNAYTALLDLLADEDDLGKFIDYLQEVGT